MVSHYNVFQCFCFGTFSLVLSYIVTTDSDIFAISVSTFLNSLINTEVVVLLLELSVKHKFISLVLYDTTPTFFFSDFKFRNIMIFKNWYLSLRSRSKKNDKINFSKKTHFLKNVSRFKTISKKIFRFTQCMVQVSMRLCKKIYSKNIQY